MPLQNKIQKTYPYKEVKHKIRDENGKEKEITEYVPKVSTPIKGGIRPIKIDKVKKTITVEITQKVDIDLVQMYNDIEVIKAKLGIQRSNK